MTEPTVAALARAVRKRRGKRGHATNDNGGPVMPEPGTPEFDAWAAAQRERITRFVRLLWVAAETLAEDEELPDNEQVYGLLWLTMTRAEQTGYRDLVKAVVPAKWPDMFEEEGP